MTSSADLRVSTLFNFTNHVVLITGGGSGLGEMAAQGFVQNGAKVFIASRKESELKKATDRLNQLGPGKCEYIVADLKDRAGCDALVKEVKKRTDRLTVLVNNTGVTWGAPYHDFPESGWDKVMALNVKSIFYMTAGLHDLLLKNTSADMPSRVINIASMAGIMTSDVTAGDDGGLAAPGTGTYSCKYFTYQNATALKHQALGCSLLLPIPLSTFTRLYYTPLLSIAASTNPSSTYAPFCLYPFYL